jgi:hypothetical protein
MGTKKEATARWHKDEAGAIWCYSDWASAETMGRGGVGDRPVAAATWEAQVIRCARDNMMCGRRHVAREQGNWAIERGSNRWGHGTILSNDFKYNSNSFKLDLIQKLSS